MVPIGLLGMMAGLWITERQCATDGFPDRASGIFDCFATRRENDGNHKNGDHKAREQSDHVFFEISTHERLPKRTPRFQPPGCKELHPRTAGIRGSVLEAPQTFRINQPSGLCRNRGLHAWFGVMFFDQDSVMCCERCSLKSEPDLSLNRSPALFPSRRACL